MRSREGRGVARARWSREGRGAMCGRKGGGEGEG